MTYGTNAPNGLVPVSTLSGASMNFAQPYTQMQIAGAYPQNLFIGDPLAPLSNGTVGIGVVGASGSVPTLGIFNGCVYTNSAGTIIPGGGTGAANFWASGTVIATGTTATAVVLGLDPNTLYSVQSNTTAGVALTENFANANFVAGAGNTLTGISGFMLDESTISTVGTQAYANLRIWGVDTTGGNNNWSVSGSYGFNNVIVSINNHFARAGSAGL